MCVSRVRYPSHGSIDGLIEEFGRISALPWIES